MGTEDKIEMDRPQPLIDQISKPFWDACKRGVLQVQRCRACRSWSYPAKLSCSTCQSTDLDFEAASGDGVLYSFTVQRQAFHAGFIPHLPNVVAMVELDDCPGVHLVANIVDVEVGDIAVGMAVRTEFDDRGDVAVPVFRPAHPSV